MTTHARVFVACDNTVDAALVWAVVEPGEADDVSTAGGWKRDPETGQWVANPMQPAQPAELREALAPSGRRQPVSTYNPSPSAAVGSGHGNPAPQASGPTAYRPSGESVDGQQKSPWKSGWILVGVAAVVVLVVGLVVSQHASSSTTSIEGTVVTRGMMGTVYDGQSCSSYVPGTLSVTVYNDTGRVVGTTTLTSGTGVELIRPTYGIADSCSYPLYIAGVPADSSFYTFAKGNDMAHGKTISAAEVHGRIYLVFD